MERSAIDRIGSPTAVDPVASEMPPAAGLSDPVDAVPPTDLGPSGSAPAKAAEEERRLVGSTPAAALVSAIGLLAFAALAWYFFPAGGIAVAALGVAMSALGQSSRRPKLAIVVLGMHALLVVACCLRAIWVG